MKIIDRLTKIDRRIIYLILIVVVALPLIVPSVEKVRVMAPVEKLFNAIENIPEEKALIIDFDYAPQTAPELDPMGFALLRHVFKTRVKLIVISLYVQPLGLAQKALTEVIEEYNSEAQTHEDSIVYGRDYVFLGWVPPPIIPILGMGESITNVYQVDYYGNRTDTLELMRSIKNYNDVGLLISLSGGNPPKWWVQFAQSKFGLPIGAGVTAVSASEFYPYLQSGQFSGLMIGMKGAAEYEEIIERELNIKRERKASEALPSLTYAHLVIIVFIVIGNIGYLIKRRSK
ncbi:hypothetical protein AMJ52_02975 [candidate division TA06 bacterium DG_78]|uniref:Uncharacterized protein n=1 Tax=candidate division TA06 bacterium DG_78 TaxID=1703772 RepID=A0A0S7YGC2_UNCT6|nr:MAG: hypothetical protein AMJ52_02975 [candidate division TA06 bacterium DG_78]